jgi:hypothetical protein
MALARENNEQKEKGLKKSLLSPFLFLTTA